MTPPRTALCRGMIGRNAEQVRIAQVFAWQDPPSQARRSPTVKCWRSASLQINKLSNANTEKFISFRLVTSVSHQISSTCGDPKSHAHVFFSDVTIQKDFDTDLYIQRFRNIILKLSSVRRNSHILSWLSFTPYIRHAIIQFIQFLFT